MEADAAAEDISVDEVPVDGSPVDFEAESDEEAADIEVPESAEGRPATKRRRRRGRGGRAADADAGLTLETPDSALADESEAVDQEALEPSITTEVSPILGGAVLRRFDHSDWRERAYTLKTPTKPARTEAPTAIDTFRRSDRDQRGFDRPRAAPRFETAAPSAEPVIAPAPQSLVPAPESVVAPAAILPQVAPGTTSRVQTDDRLEQFMANQSALLQQQQQVLQSIASTLSALQAAVTRMTTTGIAAGMPRAGIFVDAPNILYAAESARVSIDYGRMLDFLGRGREMVHAIVYAPVTEEGGHRYEHQRFVAPFLNKGYKLVTKPLKRFPDGTAKGNFDIELAIDIVTMSQRLDVVILISGDSDFSRLIELIQSRGVRVEVVAFASNVSWELVQMADVFIDIGTYLHEFRAV